MNTEHMQALITVLHQEVVPALGCTEPITVALAAAKAVRELGEQPERINVELSGNLLKNGMGVGDPGTGMVGLDIAAAVGALGGNPDLGLETLRDITTEHVQAAKQMLAEGRVHVTLSRDKDVLFASVTVEGKSHTARADIRGAHTNVVLLARDGNTTWEQGPQDPLKAKYIPELCLADLYDFATTVPYNDIAFILEGARLNSVIAAEGLKKSYGLNLGRTIAANIELGLALYASSITH